MKVVLEQAIAAAKELEHSYAGTEHLLLGLIREERGLAAQVLSDVGVTEHVALAELLRLLGMPPMSLEELGTADLSAVELVEVSLHVRDGRRFQGSFQNIRDAISFLEMLERRDPA